ncbi:hypothetical protein AWB74_03307 [Caballeronia arvi]|uniref:Purine nucleoside phosphorylase n=1 Tax=Caballeronia arvi TaxID=1777135 RepID=A0A158J2C8_9BURK|nr:hypothetical protein [Caballeronia arvi]SAL63092.1 hypothetical protein AWB74_03307 [Caballeronia arvi]
MKRLVMLAVATAAFVMLLSAAMAQGAASSGVAATASQVQPVSAPMTKVQQKAKAKVERKETRRQARAARNAELKRLEKNGFGPQASPAQYPENMTNAERKAAAQSKSAVPASTPGQ